MRYQQYKNKMLKVRKVIDFFYRFRFVFAGAITAIVAASITLDVTRGNIVQTSEFKMTYMYGEEIDCSGSAFLGNVTYEFRRKGDKEWSEEKPIYPGEYEARAKSQGSHGYKYSDESSFEIKPCETVFKIKDGLIRFGNDSPELVYELLPGDRLEENYRVNYADKTVKQTTASIDVNSLRIYNKDNVDVTACYSITAIDNEIEFIPEQLTFTFNNPGAFTFTGDEAHPFSCDDYSLSGSLYYDAQPVITGGVRRSAVGSEQNHHNIAIVDAEGNDYTANYTITTKENTITVNKAAAITIESSSMEKTYDDEPFAENQFSLTKVEGLLSNIHEIKDVVYNNIDVKNCADATNIANSFTYKIVDKRTNAEINPLDYYQGVNVKYGTINIKKVPIKITTPTINHTFDNKPVEGYHPGDEVNYTGNLVGDDFIAVDEYPTKNEPGVYANRYVCHVYRKMMVGSVLQDVDVTSNYNISYATGNINIEVEPIVIKFDGRSVDYTGGPHNVYQNSNQGYITSGQLPTGWTFNATVYDSLSTHNPFTMTNALTDSQSYYANERQVETTIWDEYGNPMTDYFRIDNDPSHSNDANCDVTFVFEESRINKVDLAITITDFDPIEYNQKTLEENLDLASRVTSVGLKGDDVIEVSYLNANQKTIKNARTTPYSVSLNIQVINSTTGLGSGGNYNTTYNRPGNIATSVQINKKKVKIYTPDIKMVYYDSNVIPQKNLKFDNVIVYDEDDNPIDNLKVSFDKSKQYVAPSEEVGTYNYVSFDESDLIISDKYTGEVYHQAGVHDNYTIDLQETGMIEITKRPIEIYQVDDESKDYIFYDENYHGVLNGSREVKYTVQQNNNDDTGLVTTSLHVLTFTKVKSYITPNEDGNPRLVGDGVADKVDYFGVKIWRNNDPEQDVTSNYDITFTDDYIRINIIRKKIDIYSGSDKKVFDGDAFDLCSEYGEDQWVNIDDMKAAQFEYTVTRYDDHIDGYVGAFLDEGDVLQVKKTTPSILEDSKNVGYHSNEFDWQIVDKNGNVKNRSFYNVNEHPGTLEVKKLNIDLIIDHREKEYDSSNITFPNGYSIESGFDGYQVNVNEDSREQGVCLDYRPVYDTYGPDPSKIISFNKTAFEKNFSVLATIYKGIYSKFYLAGDYAFDIYAFIHTKDTDQLYDDTSNVELSFDHAVLNYHVVKPRIELQRTAITTTLELRILIGTLKANDVLYFGTEKYTTQLGRKPRTWGSDFIRSNVHIYRNDNPEDEVTDCYNIVM